jgi:hypothetical protein
MTRWTGGDRWYPQRFPQAVAASLVVPVFADDFNLYASQAAMTSAGYVFSNALTAFDPVNDVVAFTPGTTNLQFQEAAALSAGTYLIVLELDLISGAGTFQINFASGFNAQLNATTVQSGLRKVVLGPAAYAGGGQVMRIAASSLRCDLHSIAIFAA